jgi:HlyD family secretion protein
MKWNELLERVPAPLRKRPLILIGLAVVLVVPLVWFSLPKPKEAATAFHEVRRGDFTVTVLDRGTLTAVSEISIRSEVEGTARIIYIVPEGTYAKKGDLLVELDSSQAQDQVNLQTINFEKAQFALVQAEAQLQIQQSVVESDIRAAELKVRFAKLDLDKFDEGQRLVDLIEASNKVVQAEAQLAVNRENYTWTTNLAVKGYETKQKVDVDRLAVMNNENSLLVASNSIWMLQKFDLPKQREKFLSDHDEAKKELERVKAQSERKIEQYKADMLSQSNTLALNQKKLERDRKNLDACKIKAKQDGLVVYSMSENRFSSESLIEEGAIVRNRQELIKLPDTSRMKVTIKVHESHVGLVQVGQPAFVKLDSMPDQRFQGVVEKVALLPDSQSRFGNPNLKVYNTEVVITDPLPGVKPGVSAQAEIMITNISNALSVPLQAVTTLKGRQVVYAQQGSGHTPVPVQVGMFNTKFIEITTGIKEGDRVLLSPPFDTQERDLEGAVLAADEKAKAATNSAARRLASGPPRGAKLTNSLDAPESVPSNRPARAPEGQQPRGGSTETDLAAAGPASQPDSSPRNRPSPSELLKEFDKDGDGQLNATERAAMQLAMETRFGGRGQGGPRLSQEEMLKRFDKNGDGKLDEQERAAMRESMGGGRGDRGPRPNRGEGRERSPSDGTPGPGAPNAPARSE